jgi:CRISPR-associated protein Cas1
MPQTDYHELPRFDDSLSYVYLEHGSIDRHEKSIAFHDQEGRLPIPIASVRTLLLGPGTKITQAAVQTLADNNCLLIWCGEENVRFYAVGMGGTRSASRLLKQARLACDERLRLGVVQRMYRMRFDEDLDPSLTVQELRGREGLRVRNAYARLSAESGVEWTGRFYERDRWGGTDPVNRAISTANSCLYGICHAAIVSAGYSPALGFIHTGKQLSFVYDVADLYKLEISLPIAFRTAAEAPPHMDRVVRLRCRDRFRELKLMDRIIPDIRKALGDTEPETEFAPDGDPALPTALWTPSWEEGAGEI